MMTLSLYKESRTLMPAFAVTVVAMVLEAMCLGREALLPFEIFTLGAGCAFLGAGVFGEEYHTRTMPLLLSHPMPRQKIWFEKMKVLGVALAIVFGVFLASTNMRDESIAFIAIPILALFTGPGIGLGARSTFMGALSLYAWPFMIWLAMVAGYSVVMWLSPDAGSKLGQSFDYDPYPYLIVPGVIYTAWFYWISRRQFLRLEVVDVYGRPIGLPARLESKLGRMMARVMPGYTNPLASLFRKELQLQKPSYLLAVIACVGTVVVVAPIWMIHHSAVVTGLFVTNPAVCVVIIPLITMGMAVAEERSLGLLAWQRTLPPSALKQWLVKLTVSFGTSLLLGIVLPVVLVNIWVLLTEHKVAGIPIPHDAQTGLIALNAVVGYLLLICLVMFASSASKSTFRAILLGILLVTLTGLCGLWAMVNNPVSLLNDNLRDLALNGTPWVMICTLLLTHILTYRNYRVIEMTGRRIMWQSVVILLPMVIWGLCFYRIRNILDWTGPRMDIVFN